VSYTLLCLAKLPRVPKLLNRAALALDWLVALLLLLVFIGGPYTVVALLRAASHHRLLAVLLVSIYVLIFLAVRAARESTTHDQRVVLRQEAEEAQAIAGMKAMQAEIENWGRTEEDPPPGIGTLKGLERANEGLPRQLR